MAKFIRDSELNSELEKIFEKAEDVLVLISPYIKLHSRFLDVLKSKKQNDRLLIILVFGKNEDDISKSLSEQDFNFLKEFPNVEIRYEPRLHAKYYANEAISLLSSMNLYDFSQNNNIEFGILTSRNSLSNLVGDKIDEEAHFYFQKVVENSELLFQRAPKYKDTMLGLKKVYTHSETEKDQLSEKYKGKKGNNKNANTGTAKVQNTGYCIRTGEKIPFNPERPLSDNAFKSWSKFGDRDYSEKYCHFSGEPSNGETSFSKPILRKNWNKAKPFM